MGLTLHATTAQCAGNKGAVIIFNELGKFAGKDMSGILYDLSEGTDKSRLDSKMKVYTPESYHTSIISAGEISLLSRCREKLEGKEIRVMELNCALTNDAGHSRRIKEACRKNNGWAAAAVAQYILDNGGAEFVLEVYRGYCSALSTEFPDFPSKERFIEKFGALYMATAEIAGMALNIDFDMEGLYRFLLAYENEKGSERNVSANSYDVLIEECRINTNSFYTVNDYPPVGKIYGRIERVDYTLPDGRMVMEEFIVRREFVEKVLKEKGFPNLKTCAKAWKDKGVLDYEDETHLTRSRMVEKGGKKERVFVFRVFADPAVEERDDY